MFFGFNLYAIHYLQFFSAQILCIYFDIVCNIMSEYGWEMFSIRLTLNILATVQDSTLILGQVLGRKRIKERIRRNLGKDAGVRNKYGIKPANKRVRWKSKIIV